MKILFIIQDPVLIDDSNRAFSNVMKPNKIIMLTFFRMESCNMYSNINKIFICICVYCTFSNLTKPHNNTVVPHIKTCHYRK